MCCRLMGFIMFWIAVGMLLALFIAENTFLCVCIIIAMMIIGFNMFCS
jgi:hypothetical protein